MRNQAESKIMTVQKQKELYKGRVLYPQQATISARYRLNDIFSTAWLSHAISALAKHGIADLISDEPVSADELASKSGLHAPSLYRALRALAANGIFEECEGKKFRHNEISVLLSSDHPYSWKGMACMWNHPSCLQAWSGFAECLKDGKSGIQHAFGKPLYEHLEDVHGGTLAFSNAMISNSAHVSNSIAEQFPFHNYSLIMDLAGGIGTLLAAILKRHPKLEGVLLEIKELESVANKYLQQHSLTDRASFITGDFLSAVPPGADLFLIKNSLWNWSDEQCSTILKNVHYASRSHSADLLIIEYIIDDDNIEWTSLYDLQILNMPGGRARTLEEYEILLNENGFTIKQVEKVEDQTLITAKSKAQLS